MQKYSDSMIENMRKYTYDRLIEGKKNNCIAYDSAVLLDAISFLYDEIEKLKEEINTLKEK